MDDDDGDGNGDDIFGICLSVYDLFGGYPYVYLTDIYKNVCGVSN